MDVYHTSTWEHIRKNVWIKQTCLCNRCGRPVYVNGISPWIPPEKRLRGIVHHIIPIEDRFNPDPVVAYTEENLEGICIDCHNREHKADKAIRDGAMFDEEGNLIPTDSPHRWKSDER